MIRITLKKNLVLKTDIAKMDHRPQNKTKPKPNQTDHIKSVLLV